MAISPVVAAAVAYTAGMAYAIWREPYVAQGGWEEGAAGWTFVAEPGTVLTYPDSVLGWMWVAPVGVVAGLAVARVAGVRAWPVMLLVGVAAAGAVMVTAVWLQVLIVAAATVLGVWGAGSLEPPNPATRRLDLVLLLGIPVSVAASMLVSGIVGVDLLGPVDDALGWVVPTMFAGLLTGLVLASVAGVERRRSWIVAVASALVPAVVVLVGVSPAWPAVQVVMAAAAALSGWHLQRPDLAPDPQTGLAQTQS